MVYQWHFLLRSSAPIMCLVSWFDNKIDCFVIGKRQKNLFLLLFFNTVNCALLHSSTQQVSYVFSNGFVAPSQFLGGIVVNL